MTGPRMLSLMLLLCSCVNYGEGANIMTRNLIFWTVRLVATLRIKRDGISGNAYMKIALLNLIILLVTLLLPCVTRHVLLCWR